MHDLVQWLGEQLAEDKRIAWAWQDRRCDGCGTPAAARGVYGLVKCTACDPGDVPLTNDRALREIDAKRQLLKEHAPGTPKGRPNMERHCLTCSTAQAWDEAANEANCLTLRLLAAPYDHRPGYRDAWRP